jgi:hypothetical protein
MRSLTRATALCACAGAFLAAAPGAQAACTSSTPATTTFADGRTDAGRAPELTDVTVSLDAACRFSMSPGIETFTEEAVLLTFIDRDGNATTGSADFGGADVLVATLGEAGTAPVLGIWDGADFVFIDEIAGATTPSPGGFSAGVDHLAIEPGATVGVRVVSMRYDDEDEDLTLDWAPEPDAAAGILLPALYEGTAIVPSVPPPALDPEPTAPTVTPPAPRPTVASCTVPKVKGRSRAAANERLARTGCRTTATVVRRYSPSVRKGRVIGTTPRTGTRTGKRVKLIVSKGPRPLRRT